MTYVIYNTETKNLLKRGSLPYLKTQFKTESAAKAALTRLASAASVAPCVSKLHKFKKEQHAVVEYSVYLETIQPPVEYETVINLMSGLPVRQAKGTPLCCDVSSETYWSM